MQWDHAGRTVTAGDGTCECGLRADDESGACATLRDALLARDFEQPVAYWRYHRLAVDAYCLQHAAYVKSATSFAAHAGGLCIALEQGNDRGLHESFIRWLNAPGRELMKPPLPASRGVLTIAHVARVDDPIDYGRRVGEWAAAVWDAYAASQPLARDWVRQARAFRPTKR